MKKVQQMKTKIMFLAAPCLKVTLAVLWRCSGISAYEQKNTFCLHQRKQEPYASQPILPLTLKWIKQPTKPNDTWTFHWQTLANKWPSIWVKEPWIEIFGSAWFCRKQLQREEQHTVGVGIHLSTVFWHNFNFFTLPQHILYYVILTDIRHYVKVQVNILATKKIRIINNVIVNLLIYYLYDCVIPLKCLLFLKRKIRLRKTFLFVVWSWNLSSIVRKP